MKIDSAGNLYCCGPGGIHVFDPGALCLGVIHVPEHTANFAWGDHDVLKLYHRGIPASVKTLTSGRPTEFASGPANFSP